MFLSLGPGDADRCAIDQDVTSADGPGEMSFGPVRSNHRARHAQSGDNGSDIGEVDAVDAVDASDEAEDYSSIVRPYSWTRGRTRPVQDLALETLVSTSDEGWDMTTVCSAEHAAIVQLCAEVRSVAEVAALLVLPLGVARVLLADMIGSGLVHVHRNSLGSGSAQDLSLLERVLEGLHRL
jgi:Protein of unknown function (DUF742)